MTRNMVCVTVGTIALAGCIAAPSRPQAPEDIKAQISVTSGSVECPKCSKLITYKSPLLAHAKDLITAPDKSSGWINVKTWLRVTNDTPGNIPKYQLVAELVNSGPFVGSIYFSYYKQDELIRMSPWKSGGTSAECWNNVGGGCSWVEVFDLPVSFMDEATANGVKLFVGRPFQERQEVNDGYKNTITYKAVGHGLSFSIPGDKLAAFVAGLKERGAEMPSAEREMAYRKGLADAMVSQAMTNALAIKAERPQKNKIGTQICKKQNQWIYVGYVEQVESEKIRIRVSDATLGGSSNIRPGGFQAHIVWDNPDNWYICRSL